MRIKKANFMKDNKHNKFWDKGFKKGHRCARHPDAVIQEEWGKTVPFGVWTYENFVEWLRGYKFGKRNNY